MAKPTNKEVLTDAIEELKTLKRSCRDGINGLTGKPNGWDPSIEGFEAMEQGCLRVERTLSKLRKELGR